MTGAYLAWRGKVRAKDGRRAAARGYNPYKTRDGSWALSLGVPGSESRVLSAGGWRGSI